ncbi:MAG: hypothetical protein WC381_02855 [Kiritimatiellia bacterium]|jgi:hypothetical protein
MRTTLDFPDTLARRAKTVAVRRGITLKALVTQALEENLDAVASKPSGGSIKFPLVRSRKPGALLLTPDDIHDILLREESAAYETAMRR